jgi:hypothetical protein
VASIVKRGRKGADALLRHMLAKLDQVAFTKPASLTAPQAQPPYYVLSAFERLFACMQCVIGATHYCVEASGTRCPGPVFVPLPTAGYPSPESCLYYPNVRFYADYPR